MLQDRIVRCLFTFALLLSAETSATAQGTEAQREACTPDAFRLCGAYIPDVDRITACLRSNGSRLSKPCYDVFFPAPPPDYAAPRYVPPPNGGPRRRYQRPPQDPYYDDDN
jgi:hypothetical protein